MAKDVIIRGVTYPGVDKLSLPVSSGLALYRDTSDADAAAGDILSGKKAYGASGALNGSMTNQGAVSGTISDRDTPYSIPAGYHNGSGAVEIAIAERNKLLAENIRLGVTILGVAGNYGGGGSGPQVISGRDKPTSSLGNDGDIYEQIIPIPSGITFVDYLESNGNQYINTGIYATQDIDAVVTGDRRTGNANSGCMLGVRTGAWSSMSKVLYFGSHTDSSNAVSAIKSGSSVSGTIGSASNVVTRRTKTTKDENGYYVYTALIDEQPSYSKIYRQTGTWRSDMPICMFGFYQGTTLNKSGSTRVKRATLTDKGTPCADYLPCLDGSNVACMWDNIAQEYVYNDGTGTFAYGSILSTPPDELDPVYYVKVNGEWAIANGEW